MNNFGKPTMLMILDGYGYNPETYGNAIAMAKKPFLDDIFLHYPNSLLDCSGLDVGLPKGQMGNSEVGHLNIGSGRVIYQDLTKITKSIDDRSFFKNPALLKAMTHARERDTALHLLGLVSNGGVHSHMDHIFALIDMAKKNGISKLYIHAFLDGRDVPPNSGLGFIEELEAYMKKVGLGRIASVSGRYYAMDRDKRWARLEKAYDAMTLGQGHHNSKAMEAVEDSYFKEEYDEFMLPTIIDPRVTVEDGDAMIMFNYRPDRAREITRAFVDIDFEGFERMKVCKDLCYVCMTQYDASIRGVEIAFPPEHYDNTLGHYISSLRLKQLRIAETEKYAHVTFFFNGGVEAPEPGEDRMLIPSPKVATYDLMPEMSAYTVADTVLKEIESDRYDLIILNFANADMVGHTGNLEATIKAIEALDECAAKVIKAILAKNGQILLTADHGNADCMLDENEAVVTSHSLNPVPIVNISSDPRPLKKGGKLSDIAPTLLEMMGLQIPKEMTGKSLLKK